MNYFSMEGWRLNAHNYSTNISTGNACVSPTLQSKLLTNIAFYFLRWGTTLTNMTVQCELFSIGNIITLRDVRLKFRFCCGAGNYSCCQRRYQCQPRCHCQRVLLYLVSIFNSDMTYFIPISIVFLSQMDGHLPCMNQWYTSTHR